MIEGEVYLKNNLEGMTNDQLILFIYQEMLKILNQVTHYFKINDIENRVNGINKAIEVVNALLSILNFNEGGEIAIRLRSLYLYAIKKLTAANFERNPQLINEVNRIFKDLHDGWSEKIEKDKKSNLNNPPVDRNPFPAPGGAYNSGSLQGLEIYG